MSFNEIVPEYNLEELYCPVCGIPIFSQSASKLKIEER
jgi:hypothetical protein